MASYIGKSLPNASNGNTFTADNFLQLSPQTQIFEGITGLTFINCNLTNCAPPADAVFVGCSPHHVEFCSHVHPHFVDHGLPVCTTNCSHVVITDTITIDGVVVDTIYHYSDGVVA